MTTITPQSLVNIAEINLRGDRNPLLNEILTIVGREMRAHSGSIMLVNEVTCELEMVATFGPPDDDYNRKGLQQGRAHHHRPLWRGSGDGALLPGA